MVELLVTFALLFPALLLAGLAFNGKPWAGLFSGMLLLIFGVMLLGTGFQFGEGLTSNSTGYRQYLNTSVTYQNFTVNTSTYSSLGVFSGSTLATEPHAIYENITVTSSGLSSSVNNYSVQKDSLTDGTSVLFIFLGLTVMALSLFIIGKNRDTYDFKVRASESED